MTTEHTPASLISSLFDPCNIPVTEQNITKCILAAAFRWRNVRLFLSDRYLDPNNRNPNGKNYFVLIDALIELLSNPEKKVEKKFIYEGPTRLLPSLLISMGNMFKFLSLDVEIEHEKEEVLTLRLAIPQTEAAAA